MQNANLVGTRPGQTAFTAAAALLLVAAALLLLLRLPAEAQANDRDVSGVTLTSPNPGELVIAWDAPGNAPDDYRITWKKSTARWHSYKNANTVEGGNAFPTGTSHTVTGLEGGTAYQARVRARYHNSGGKVEKSGPWSAAQEVTVSVTSAPTPQPTAAPTAVPTAAPTAQPPANEGRSTNPPAKPAGLLAAASHDSVLLSWTDPGDGSITGYQVLRGPGADNLAVLVDDTGDANASYTDSNVSAQTTYVYAVKGRNADGLGPQSDPVSATTPAAPRNVPEAEGEDLPQTEDTTGRLPVGGSVTGAVDARFDQDWYAVELTPGTDYVIDQRGEPSGGGTQLDPFLMGLYDAAGQWISGTTAPDGGVGIDSRLYYRATTGGRHYVSAAGNGDEATGTGTYTLSIRDLTVGDADATPAGATGWGDITGEASESDVSGAIGGADRTDYYSFTLGEPKLVRLELRELRRNADLYLEDGEGLVLAESTETRRNNESISQALGAGTYHVRVSAREGQSGAYTLRRHVSARRLGPAGLTTVASHDSVLLSWTDPGDDSITGYQVLRGPDAASLTVLTDDTESAGTGYTDSTVDAETGYAYAVRARNAGGLGPQSDPVSVTTPAAPPAKPAGLLAAASHDSVLLSWTDPGDGSITGYQVLRGPGADNLAVLVDDTGDAAASYTDSTVDAETGYAYAVRARNAGGLGPQSDPVSVTTPAAPPAKPAGLITAASHDSVLLSWTDPGDGSITGYQVLRGPDADTLAVLADDTESTDAPYTDETVEPETGYAYAVRARNAGGLGPQSDPVSVTTPAAPPEIIAESSTSEIVTSVSEGRGVDFPADSSTSGAVVVGEDVTGAGVGRGDRDWFAVSLLGGEKYYIRCWDSDDHRGGPTHPYLVHPVLYGIYDSDSTRLYTGSFYNCNSRKVLFVPEADGIYYLEMGVGEYGGALGELPSIYGFRVNVVPDNCRGTYDTNCNIEAAGDWWEFPFPGRPGYPGKAKVGQVERDRPGDRDWFRLSVEEGYTYRIFLKRGFYPLVVGSSGAEPLVWPLVIHGVYQSDGTRIHDKSTGYGSTAVNYRPSADENIYIEVGSEGDQTGGYILKVVKSAND